MQLTRRSARSVFYEELPFPPIEVLIYGAPQLEWNMCFKYLRNLFQVSSSVMVRYERCELTEMSREAESINQ